MNLSRFEVQVPGKWILAGEHTVLRGSPALVFPLKSRTLELSYMPLPQAPLHLELAGEHGEELQLLFWGVLEKACELTRIQRNDLIGTLKLSSRIPIGAGLGASAALCVAIGRWFESMGLVKAENVYEFSRTLENMFHGESSGVDIAVALSGEGIRFLRAGERKPLPISWSPRWFVSYSGQRGVTLECVNKVKALMQKDPRLGEEIDRAMKKAVDLAEVALAAGPVEGLQKLKESINLARSCFELWGLSPDSHIQYLLSQGAVAAKPTGSGDGGFVLSLWDKEPPEEVRSGLIPCLEN
jgi:mevalonate kinase